MIERERLLKRLKKRAKRGMRGWPVATIAFYGPDLSRATKAAVGIVPAEGAEPSEMLNWSVETGDVRNDLAVLGELLGLIESQGALTVIIADGIMGCPHQQGIDYEGDYCPNPACAFWLGRDRFTGKLIQ
jgi:hypothetical protein